MTAKPLKSVQSGSLDFKRDSLIDHMDKDTLKKCLHVPMEIHIYM